MICFPLDNTEYEASALGAWCCTRTRGVFAADGHFAVTANDDMTVTVSPGLAWLKASQFWGVNLFEINPSIRTIDTPDGSLARIDAVCIRLDKNQNRGEIVIKKGSYSPQPPVITPPVRDFDYDEIYVATILVPAGAAAITQVNITDTRMDETVCGLMRDGVTGIPTAELQAQVEALIADLRKQISNAAAGIISPSQIGAMGIGANNGAVGTKYTISLEPDTADNAASIIRIKENATGNPRVLIAANTDVNTGEVSQIVLRDGTNVGKINIQCNTAGAKGIRITDGNNVERIKLLHTTTDDTCRFQINDASGNDVTLQTIGAQATRLTFTDLAVPVSAWEDDAYDQYADFPYQAQVACAGVTADMFAEVVLNPADAISGNYAPICVTGAGIVWLYAKAIPSAAITIRSIVAWM